MNSQPLVSAIITTCNRPTAIVGRALASVERQTYDNLEIIIVNDYPENDSLNLELIKLAENSSRKVKYVCMKKNSGGCAARNRGIEESSGDFIAFLDDDDEWLENKIEMQAAKMISSDSGIVYCNFFVSTEKKQKKKLQFSDVMPEGQVYNSLFARNFIGSSSFPMIRKSCFNNTGYFDIEMPALQDWDLWLRITRNYAVSYIKKPLGIYYFYKGDRVSAHPERRVEGYEKIQIKHEKCLSEHPKSQADFDAMGVTIYVNYRDFKEAWSHLKRAVKLSPLRIKRNLYIFIKYIVRFFVKPGII